MKIPASVLTQLKKIAGEGRVLTDDVSLSLYAYDCSLSRTRPDALINVASAQDVAPILRVLYQHHIPFVPRASATNHAGSCAALNGGVILNLAGLNRILQINTQEGYAVAEACAITGDLQDRLAPLGFFYAPDPASERVSTLGGNLAQNASGARCMKFCRPGDVLTLSAKVLRLRHPLAMFEGSLLVNGQKGAFVEKICLTFDYKK